MNTISPRFTGELRDRLTLSDVVGKKVKLARAGREFKGCCPFHNEKTPSFYVNDDKQFYHCFGCGAHGDAIGFLMQHDNMSFIDAIEALASEAGMQVPKASPQDRKKAEAQKSLHSLMDDATQFFRNQLHDIGGRDALQYLHERGVSETVRESFRVGYAPATRNVLPSYLKGKGYSDEQMLEAGLVRRSERDGSLYAFFRDRVMFPVTDRRGRVVAFGGRILPEHLRPPEQGDYKPAKYINSSDTPIFHKGRILFGEPHARQAALDDMDILVVEGYLDVMACFEAGFKGAVAPMGTALTEEQILKLWKLIPSDTKVPVLCFDGDNAGKRAAFRACENILPLLKPDQSIKIAFLPEGQDPDSLIKSQGRAAFASIVDAAMPLVEFLWSHYTSGKAFKTPEERAGLSKTLDEQTGKIADRSVQQNYSRVFRDKTYQHFRNTGFQKNNRSGNGRGHAAVPLTVRKPAYSGQSLPYQILLAAVLNHPYIFPEVEEDLGAILITQERLDSMRQSILNLCGANHPLDRDALHSHLKDRGFEAELKTVLSETVYTHAGFARPISRQHDDESNHMNEEAYKDDVLSGWNETIGLIQQKAVWSEIRTAGRALAENFTEENEKKILALRHSQEKPEE